MTEVGSTNDVAALTVELLSAYLSNNAVAPEDLAGLIRTTRDALTGEQAIAQVEPEVVMPAVSVRKSLASPEHIISLIDGKPYKTLKRHLMARGLTPEAYRSLYNLPASYPMVAPAYAERRRAVAQQFGLGRKKSQVGDVALRNDEELAAVGAPEVQAPHSPSSPEPVGKQRRATAEKKRGAARAIKPSAASEEASATLAASLPQAVEAGTSSNTSMLPGRQGSQDEPAGRPQDAAAPEVERVSSKPVRMKVAAGGRDKFKAQPADRAERSGEASGAAKATGSDHAVPAERPKRPKLGVFKKSGVERIRAANAGVGEGVSAVPQAQAPSSTSTAATARARAKRKIPKHMAPR